MSEYSGIIGLILILAICLPLIGMSITQFADNPISQTIFHYDITTGIKQLEINDQDFAVAVYASNSSSILVGDIANCVEFMISKEGNPLGSATIGIFDSSGNPTEIWASPLVSEYTDSPVFYQYCFEDYTIQIGDRIGIRYNSATENDLLNIWSFEGDAFDGDSTRTQQFNTIWVEEGDELNMILYFTNSELEIFNTLFWVIITIVLVTVILGVAKVAGWI